jgi:hypothetical protein
MTGEPIETEEKEEQDPTARPRKTLKYMTKYERARILRYTCSSNQVSILISSDLCEVKILFC